MCVFTATSTQQAFPVPSLIPVPEAKGPPGAKGPQAACQAKEGRRPDASHQHASPGAAASLTESQPLPRHPPPTTHAQPPTCKTPASISHPDTCRAVRIAPSPEPPHCQLAVGQSLCAYVLLLGLSLRAAPRSSQHLPDAVSLGK